MDKETKKFVLDCVYEKIQEGMRGINGTPVISEEMRKNLRKELLDMYEKIEKEIKKI